MSNYIQPIESPVGTLEWCFIDGDGKPDLQGKPKYQVDVVLTPEQAEPFKAMVDAFWEEHKPKGAKEAKSTGVYPHTVKDEEASAKAGENVYKETGKTVIRFKTGTEYVSGDKKIIKVFNSKGNEVSLHGKKIGNDSRGRAIGQIAIYDFNTAARGVTFYLNSIQLSKFVEFTGNANPSSQIDDEDGDGFEGVEGELDAVENESNETSKPRL
jgi:hypothetical protein